MTTRIRGLFAVLTGVTVTAGALFVHLAAATVVAPTIAAAAPVPITYVCANKASGQLYYRTTCTGLEETVPVTPTSTQFKACYSSSSGFTDRNQRRLRRGCSGAANRWARGTPRLRRCAMRPPTKKAGRQSTM